MERDRRVFIATAEATDPEMEQRIARHRKTRGEAFMTIEEPLDLAGALGRVPGGTETVLVDCLTVWAGNLMHRYGEDEAAAGEVERFIEALGRVPFDLVIVTNEVGMGIVPAAAAVRKYRDLAGRINQRVAAAADSVIFTVSGIPIQIK
jgi:adenosylcobinamide kinase/adenosylcobinamide-phosphate guanylyltransferase